MTTKQKKTEFHLDTDLNLRPAQRDDLEPVARLMLDVCTNDGDPTIATSAEELRGEWEAPGFDLESDAWVVTTADGRVVGYEELRNRYAHAYLMGDGYVHPDFMGSGIGTAMLRALEARALAEMELAEPELRVFIRNGMAIGDSVAREMHEAEGYQAIRYYWRMEITLPTPYLLCLTRTPAPRASSATVGSSAALGGTSASRTTRGSPPWPSASPCRGAAAASLRRRES